MKLRLELLPGAIADMDSIWDYTVEHWGVRQAQTYLGALNARMQGLLGFPLMGVAQDWLHPGLRRVGEGSHSIYYLRTEDAVLVVRVLHERMDVTRARMTLQSPAVDYRPQM